MIPYIGGKSYLSSWIISNFPTDYKELSYVEVFGGGGWVLFKKDESFLEAYNDLNSNLVNLFKIIRDDYEDFCHRAEWSLHSREMYNEARNKLKEDKFLSDLERSLHYAISRVQSFSGNGGWAYQVNASKITSGKWFPFLKRLQYINSRLKKVQIECLDFEVLIKKYDTQNTLFYLDPPYIGVEYYYNTKGVNFSEKDHYRLAEILRDIKGKFVLSYYEHPLARSLYSGFNFQTKNTVKHSAGIIRQRKKKDKPKAKELLIKNF